MEKEKTGGFTLSSLSLFLPLLSKQKQEERDRKRKMQCNAIQENDRKNLLPLSSFNNLSLFLVFQLAFGSKLQRLMIISSDPPFLFSSISYLWSDFHYGPSIVHHNDLTAWEVGGRMWNDQNGSCFWWGEFISVREAEYSGAFFGFILTGPLLNF